MSIPSACKIHKLTPSATNTYSYDAAGNRSSVAPAGGATATYTNDGLNRLTNIAVGAANYPLTYNEGPDTLRTFNNCKEQKGSVL